MRTILLLVCVLGCGGRVDLIHPVDGDGRDGALRDAGLDAEESLALSDLRCAHSRVGPLVEGQRVACSITASGTDDRPVTLECEDPTGTPIDCCSGAQNTHLEPCVGPLDLGISISGDTSGLGGSSFSLVVIADDGVDRVRRQYDVPVVTDDGVNVPPRVEPIPCSGEVGQIEVPSGITRGCAFDFIDPDPHADTPVTWRAISGFGLAGSLSPREGTIATPYERVILWFSHDGRGGSRQWDIEVDDGIAPPVVRSILVQFE